MSKNNRGLPFEPFGFSTTPASTTPNVQSNAHPATPTPLGVETIVSLSIMTLVIFLAVVANVAVVATIVRASHLRKNLSLFFVINLSLLDLMICFLLLPVSMISFASGGWIFGQTLCKVNGFLNSFLPFCSIFSVSVISIERFYSIKAPMHHAANMSPFWTLVILSGTWVSGLLISALPLVGLNTYEYRPEKTFCSYTWRNGGESRGFIMLIGLVCFLLPVCVMTSMYLGIFRVAQRASTQVGPAPVPRPVQAESPEAGGSISPLGVAADSSPREVPVVHVHVQPQGPLSSNQSYPLPSPDTFKSLKVLTIIMGMFVILWGPHFVVHVYGACSGAEISPTTERVTCWIGFATVALNPMIYGWMNRNIRDEILSNIQRMRTCCKETEEEPDFGSAEDFFQFLERTSSTRVFSIAPPTKSPPAECPTIDEEDGRPQQQQQQYHSAESATP